MGKIKVPKYNLPSISQEVLDDLPFGAYVIDQKGLIEYFNPKMVEMSGVKKSETIIGQNVFKIPTYKKYGLARLMEAGLRGESFRVENIKYVSFVGKKESVRHYSGVPIKDEAGQVIKLLCLVEDVKVMEEIKDKVAQSEARFRELFNNMSSGVAIYEAVVKGRDFVFKDINKAGQRIDQVKKEEVVGRKITAVFPGVKDFGLLAVLQRVWQTGKPEVFPDKKYQDKRISGWRDNFVYKLQTGEVVAIYDDITAKKQAEIEIIEADRIINKSPVVIFSWRNAEGWPVEYVSLNVSNLFGYTPDEFISGKVPFSKVVHPEDLSRVAKEVNDYSKEKGRANFIQTYRIITKDKKIKWIEGQTNIRRNEKGNITHYQGLVWDITDKREAEENLKESENNFKTFFENSPDAIFIADAETTKLTDCNQNALKISGYSQEEILKMKASDLHPKDVLEETMWGFRKQAKGEVDIVDSILLTKKGKRIPVGINSTIITISGKKCLQGVFRDMTQAELYKKNLKESEEKFRQMAEKIDDVFWVVDWDSKKTIYASPAYKKTWGRPVTELLKDGFNWADTIVDEYKKQAMDNFMNLGKDKCYDEEYQIIRPDGTKRWIRDRGYPIKNEKGKVYRIVGTAQDITDKKQTERVIRESEEKYRSLINSAPNFITVIDRNFIIQSINHPVSGLKKEEVVGKSVYDFVDPNYHQMMKKAVEHVFETGKNIDYTSIAQGPDNTRAWYNNQLGPLWHDKKVEAVIIIGTDITETKKAQEELKESERKYRALYDSSRDAIMTLAPPTWRFIAGNKATIELFGCRDEKDFITRGPYDLSPRLQPDGQPSDKKAKDMIMKAMKTGSHFFEWTHQTVRGKEFPATVLLTRVELEKGQPFLQATVRDITAQNQAKRALSESEKKYRLIVDNTNDLIMLTRPDGVVTFMSEACKKVLGYKPSELMGTVPDIVYPEDKKISKIALHEKAFKGKSGKNLQYRVVTKEGKIKWISHSWQPLFENNKFNLILSIVRDINERKEAEQNIIEKNKELEKFNKMMLGRELKMVELKHRVKELEDKLKER